ncbi:MAG: hypothetical protein KDB61_05985, partial [Planctomycetes bacterium]|nr:hypothetical protein [Planctomycetota bacterium]
MRLTHTTRLLFYSHDSYGLGHLRRTLTIAKECMQQFEGATALVLTGSPVATSFDLPPGLDLVKLPSVSKDAAGQYVASGLELPFASVLAIRSEIILAALRSYRPQLMLVDHKPIGLCGELLPALEEASRLNVKTVLGLRDIIDEPESVAKDWANPEIKRALVEFYDRICVYGDPSVFDTRAEYPIPSGIDQRLQFVGYVAGARQTLGFRALPDNQPHVLVTVGGGQDGADRIGAYLDGLEADPGDWKSTIVMGPLIDKAKGKSVRMRADRLGNVRVHRFCNDLQRRMEEADVLVSMAG